MNIFTFWVGPMPAYIKLCLQTWKKPYVMLNYGNLKNYTDFDIESTKRFSLPQIADAVRVHVLRDNSGYWLDADTIMLADKLPDAMILGNPIKRTNTIGFLQSDPHNAMFEEWAAYQDKVIADPSYDSRWDVLGNRFTDSYLRNHDEIKIDPVRCRWPETYIMPSMWPRFTSYQQFYFSDHYTLSDIEETDLLMLHNSWTPEWYKTFTRDQVLSYDCTLSNILREVTK